MSKEVYLRDCIVGKFNPFPNRDAGGILPFVGDRTFSPPVSNILQSLLQIKDLILEDWNTTAVNPVERRSDDTIMHMIAFTKIPMGGNSGLKEITKGQVTSVNYRFLEAIINMYSFVMTINQTMYMSKLPAAFYYNISKDAISEAIKTNQKMVLQYLRFNDPTNNVRHLYASNFKKKMKDDPWALCQLMREWWQKLDRGVMSHWNHKFETDGCWVHHFYLLQKQRLLG